MVSNNEWEDFLSGNKHSPYARVQEANRARESLNPGAGQGVPRTGGQGILDPYFRWLADKVETITEEIPPFKQVMQFCEWLGETGWKVRLFPGAAGGLIGYLLAHGVHYGDTLPASANRWLIHHFAPYHEWAGGFGGLAFGFWLLPLTASVVRRLLCLAVGLFFVALTLALLCIGYVALAMVFDWPLPSS